jgi:hypothetical protein
MTGNTMYLSLITLDISCGLNALNKKHKSVNVKIHFKNKSKDKNHVILSIDAEKAFAKIQHHFMTKSLKNKIGTKEMLHKIIKAR